MSSYKNIRYTFIFLCTIILLQACKKEELGIVGEDFPKLLSEKGIFQNQLSDLDPATDYIFYELSSELFSDYAHKQRLIKLPLGEQLTMIGDGLPSFPNGTSIVKTFYYWNDERDQSKGRRILETRLLIRQDDIWKVGVYKWNAEQTEGRLLSSGNNEPVNWINEDGEPMVANYHIPSSQECVTCHQTDGVFRPIGPKLFNLNTDVVRNSTTVNQLEYLQQQGILNSFDITSVYALPNYHDESLSLEERSRAYMEINCSHCHSPGGFAPSFVEIDLRNSTPLAETKVTETKERLIEMVESGTMPKIGTSILDEEGVDLIVAYVNSL